MKNLSSFTEDKYNCIMNHIMKSTGSRTAQSKSHGVLIFFKSSADDYDSIAFGTFVINESGIFNFSWKRDQPWLIIPSFEI